MKIYFNGVQMLISLLLMNFEKIEWFLCYIHTNIRLKNQKPLKLNEWFVLWLPIFDLNDNNESYDTLVPISECHLG